MKTPKSPIKAILFGLLLLLFAGSSAWAQSPSKSYIECNHDSLITVLRSYEDSLALSTSTTVVRVDYAWRVTDVAVGGKVYKIYRCEALYDSLEVLMEEVAFARMTPPTVDTDSIGSISGTGATFYGKVTSDGDTAVTAQWFKYGLSAGSLTDSLAVSGVVTPFSAVASGLANGTTYYVAAFAKNVKGTSPGDTLSFTTYAKPTVDTDAATSVTSSAATLNATITATGGAVVTATGFKYGTDAGLTTPSDVASGGNSSPFTGSLTSLSPGTQYWAVGYATNSVGTSYGDTITFTTSAAASAFTCGTSTVTYDGYTYTTVQIGSQCWFKENLRTEKYRNGNAILTNIDDNTWTTTTSGAQAVYGQGTANAATNLATYGRLYNSYAVSDARGLCPTGWHVPTDAEWTALITQLGGDSNAGSKMKTAAWGGDNSSGFSALPGGFRHYSGGYFDFIGSYGYWWSSSLDGSMYWNRGLASGFSGVFRTQNFGSQGFSVRCLQDPPTAPTVDTDAASSVTSSAATLSATITATGGAAVSATGFKYGTDAGLSTPTDIAGSGTSSPFTGSLTGLSPGTQYWAVGYATNSVGTSYGDTITFTTSAAASAFTCGTSTVTYDGHAYTTVQIGLQCWFKENLRNDNYRNGDAIPGNLSDGPWTSTTSGAQTVYGEGSSTVYTGSSDETANLATYGRLYNWYAVSDSRGLCPTGWHVPTEGEWTALETHLGANAGDELKAVPPTWDGTNNSGFSALSGGFRYDYGGEFAGLGISGFWWSSSPAGLDAWYRSLGSGVSNLITYDDGNVRSGFSVRCLQDPPTAPTVDTDAATSVTATAATLNATISATGGAAVTAMGFKYATNSTLTSPSNIASSGTSSPFTASLTGLTASTQYWAVGYATNSVGTSYGDTITFTTSAAASAFTCGTSTVTYDGHAYTTVQIGSQCWFKENLRNDNYNDLSPIPGNLDNSTWMTTTSGAQAVYGQNTANETANLAAYGRLYNWHAVTDVAGLCPTGWRVPTDADWTALETHLGANAGDQLKAASPTWDGNNSSGFSALPGGFRYNTSGSFGYLGSLGSWWSSSPSGSNAWVRYLGSGDSNVGRGSSGVRLGFSVRCVQDAG